MRAGDIVRDADILHLYRQAGFERFLIGMEHTDDATLVKIKKGSVAAEDREAIKLLRKHGILSLMTCVFGFNEERDRDYFRIFRQLLAYDPDQIITLYVTPHRWTPFFRDEKGPPCHPARSKALGLQASGAAKPSHAGLAQLSLGENNRGR